MHQIYVFSSTGNTLHAAETVAAGLGEPVELVNMARVRGEKICAEGERVGVCYPVHAFGAPAVVHEFLENFSVGPASWVYLLLTSGGGPMGAATQGGKLLARRGVVMRSAFHVKMPGNYPPMRNSPSGDKLRRIVTRADGALADVIEALRVRRERTPRWPVLGWLSQKANSSALASVGQEDRTFYVSPSCVHCGVCVKVCPVDNVELGEDGTPRWGGHCTRCMACFHWCPARAVQFNTTTSPGRQRYHHPAVSPERFLAWSGR